MSSASMIGSYTCTLGARPAVTRPIKSDRLVACNASKKDAVLKIAGTAAAVQFALTLPFTGGAVAQPQFDLAFGEDLKAQAQASDAKTSAEPSFRDIGKSLNSQFGQSNSADDVGKAIKDNTPNPQDIVQGAKDASKKLNNAASDLGNVFDDLLGKAQDATGDAVGSAKSTLGDVQGNAKSASGDAQGNVKAAAGDLEGAAKSAGRSLDQATPDLSFGGLDQILGKAQDNAAEAAGAAKNAAGELKGSAKSAGGGVAGNVKEAAGSVKGAAKSTARQIDEATPNLSFGGLDEILGKSQSAAGDASGNAKSAVGGVQGSASSAAGDVASSAKQAGGSLKGAAKSASRDIQQATPDLSGVFDGLFDQGKSAVNDVKDTASKKANDAGGDINSGAKRVVGEADAIAKSAGKSK